MPVLYVVEQGAQIGSSGESLVVRREGRELSRVPYHRLSQLVLFGGVQITAAAMSELLERRIEVAFLTMRGKYKGRLEPCWGKNIVLRRAQFRRADDPEFSLNVSREIARGRLTNLRAACGRWHRDRGADPEHGREIQRCLDQLDGAQSRAELMGFEGTATRRYYSAMRSAVGEALAFPSRTRRPPTDPMSLLLSLSAALLQSQVHSAVSLVGFDPYQGYLHVDKYGRPALVLDLMEEFRPLIADSVAVSAATLKVVQADDFAQDEEGLVLKEHAVEKFVAHFDRRMRDTIAHPIIHETRAYRGWIEFQARILAQTVLGELPLYRPFTPAH